MIDSLPLAVAILLVGGVILLTAGIKFTRTVDVLADRTGIGEALAGAVLLGAATSLPGLITTITGALEGEASFAVSNAIGGIAAQTSFLVIADLIYRRTNLEHAAASLPNLLQTAILIALVGIVLMAATGPELSILGVHPASLALIVVYVYGLGLVRGSGKSPMWRPHDTVDTEVDEVDPDDDDPNSTSTLWIEFAGLAAVVAVVGYLIGQAGLTVASESGLSGSIVGALFTSVITSLPELVTVLTAVRIGALTLAVSNIVGGNTFDVLFVAAADVAFRGGSVYHSVDQQTVLVLAVTVVMTALLTGGLLYRDERYIGFEGFAILGTYAVGIAGLIAL
jgi:cation:H+ antiporter